MNRPDLHDPLFPTTSPRRAGGTRTATVPGSSRAGLIAGAVAGPLFFGSYVGQALVRDGFDPHRHPISALSTGSAGWVQVLTFVLTGLCVMAAGLALGRAGLTGRAGRWGTGLVVLHGTGLVAAGAFSADPSDGFPVGTPDGVPATLSWHAQVHAVVSITAFAAALVACLVLARPVGRAYGRVWRHASVLVPVGVVAVMAAPLSVGTSLRLAAGSALILGWIAALSLRTLSHH